MGLALGALALLLATSAISPPAMTVDARIVQLESNRSLGDGTLADLLNSRDPRIAARAALAIGRTGQRAGVAPLMKHLADAHPAVSAMVIYALGLLHDPSSAEAVIRAALAGAGRGEARQAAALDAIDRYESAGAFSDDQEHRALRPIASTLLESRSPVLRARAAETYNAFANSHRTFVISQILEKAFRRERSGFVRWHIMWTIMRGYAYRVPRSLLISAIGDRDETVRIEGIRALGRVKNPDAIATLQNAVAHDSSWRVAEQALESIRTLRKEPATEHLKSIPTVIRLPQARPDPYERIAALPRSPVTVQPAAPSAQRALYAPMLDANSLARFTEPQPGAHPRVRIVTTKGNLYLRLYPEWAPLTVENFLNLSDAGYYDNNPWFRIVPDFVVQTGGGVDGNSDVKYTIPAEENPLEQGSFVISMGLNYTDPPNAHAIRDSAGSEFYITLSPQLHLDRDFTVFGAMYAGFDVLARLVESDKIVRIERLPDA